MTEPPIRLMIVDDSLVVRAVLRDWLESEEDFSVVAAASNGDAAIRKATQLKPDLILLDLEMPVCDGLSALPRLTEGGAEAPKIIVVSGTTTQGARRAIEAIEAGASDFVAKPSSTREDDARRSFKQELFPKIRALAGSSRKHEPGTSEPPEAQPVPRLAGPARSDAVPPEILVIGASTGGPVALTSFLKELSDWISVPVAICQHMPAPFTKIFAENLQKNTGLICKEAEEGERLRPGMALIAPGGLHLTIERKGGVSRAVLNDGPPENHCKPAVDPLFRSVAESHGPAALAVVLTGMGSDGCAGAASLVAAGARVLAQDEATSVVWGMPGAVARAGLAERILPLSEMAAAVKSCFSELEPCH